MLQSKLFKTLVIQSVVISVVCFGTISIIAVVTKGAVMAKLAVYFVGLAASLANCNRLINKYKESFNSSTV